MENSGYSRLWDRQLMLSISYQLLSVTLLLAAPDVNAVDVEAADDTVVADLEIAVGRENHARGATAGDHRKNYSTSAPDPCSDPNSTEFSQGYCGGLLMCR